MAKAGNIEIRVSDGYPVWSDIRYEGECKFSIPHRELSDLKYTIEKAMQEAALKLEN